MWFCYRTSYIGFDSSETEIVAVLSTGLVILLDLNQHIFFSVIVIVMLFYNSMSLKTKMFMFRVCFIEKVRMLQKIRIAES